VLICADVIRPGLDWLLRFAPPRHNLATEMGSGTHLVMLMLRVLPLMMVWTA
jgi:hypothetical protein